MEHFGLFSRCAFKHFLFAFIVQHIAEEIPKCSTLTQNTTAGDLFGKTFIVFYRVESVKAGADTCFFHELVVVHIT